MSITGEETGALYHDYVLSKERNGGKVHHITLHEMVHIGPSRFYDYRESQFADAHARGAVIQIEGMKAPDSVSLVLRSLYSALADATGLDTQKKPLTPHEVADVTYDSLSIKDKAVFNGFATVLKGSAKLFSLALDSSESEKVTQQLRNSIIHENFDSNKKSVLNLFSSTILTARNRHAVECAVSSATDVTMVWGKAHAKGIIELLESQGYTVVSKSKVNMSDFI